MEIRNVCFEFSNTIFTSTYITCMNGSLCIVSQDSYFIYTHLDRRRCRKCLVKLAPYIKSLSAVCDWNCFCIISTYNARQILSFEIKESSWLFGSIFCRCFLRKWLLIFGSSKFKFKFNSSTVLVHGREMVLQRIGRLTPLISLHHFISTQKHAVVYSISST